MRTSPLKCLACMPRALSSGFRLFSVPMVWYLVVVHVFPTGSTTVLTVWVLACLRKNVLLIANLTSVILGVTIGLLCRPLNPSPDVVTLISFPGEIFFRMLKMLILPLMVTSIVTGLANLNGKSAGKIGLITIGYYIFTTMIAILVGLVLAIAIMPGHVINNAVITVKSADDTPSQSARDVFLDLVRNIFPDNIVQATFEMSSTVYVKKMDIHSERNNIIQNDRVNGTNDTDPEPAGPWTPTSVYRTGTNALGVLCYCVIFGVILGRLGDKGKSVLQFFVTLNDITIRMVLLVMWYSPVGIMFLIIGKVLSVDDLTSTAQQLAIYLTTIITGATLHVLILLPLLYFAVTRRNPFRIIRGMTQAIVTALAVESSSATLPVTIQCCEDNLKMNSAITRFALPLGATMNMDGSAQFYVISAIYIAQMHTISLHFFEMILLSLCAVLTSVGAAGIPNTAIAALMVVMTSVGLPTESVTILMVVDWFQGRLRTVVNIIGDCLTAAMLDHFFPQADVDIEVDADVDDEVEVGRRMSPCTSTDEFDRTELV
ncbi:excitatory amino acid transporter-like [Haliotis asinina]|uniref:excitatory amino acid transporter-like n=1 Tax=Haliotis asinina TaxID=109174 RepID=UPI003531B5D9